MSDLLKVSDVMKTLGVAESTVRKMLSRGQLPYVKLGGNSVRVRFADLEAFLDARTIRKTPSNPGGGQ
jgi:excisionase family DNA binding protein